MRTTGRILDSRARAFSRRRSTARTAAVGRVGTLALEYVRQGDRTVFGNTRCQTPWHLLPPIYLARGTRWYATGVMPLGSCVLGGAGLFWLFQRL